MGKRRERKKSGAGKRLLRSALFCLIGIGLFFAVQGILTPNWSTMENMNRTVGGIRELDPGAIDVLFVGPSTTAWGVSPMKLYEDTGICSYDLGTSAQQLACGYHLLKYAFEYQSPSLVVLEATGLFVGADGDTSWRYILENLPMGRVKAEMAEDYGRYVTDGDMWNALVPIIKYHTRWTELGAADFSFYKNEPYYTGGQYLLSLSNASTMTREAADGEAEHLLSMTEGTVRYIEDGVSGESVITEPAYAPVVVEQSAEYLHLVQELCQAHGAQLLLVKYPSCDGPATIPTCWTRTRSELARRQAEEMGIPFFDLTYDVDAGIDYATDSVEGHHLNARGAEKTTAALGAYLLEHYDLDRSGDPVYDELLKDYQKMRTVIYLQSERDFKTYLQRLLDNRDRWTVLIAARDDYVNGLGEEDYAALERLGLQLVRDGQSRYAYMAAIDKGEVRYEALSDRRIDHDMDLGDLRVSMSSSGWYTVAEASIKINGVEYAMNGRGLNIVVYDNESGLVIDSAYFDTFSVGAPVYRMYTTPMLRAYESAVCFA